MTRADDVCACLEWAVAARPIPGELDSGDRAVVAALGERVVVAAIDGLGHGPPATAAAVAAAGAIEAQGSAASVLDLVHACHLQLRAMRGAAISLALVEPRSATLEWVGVGNVEAMLLRADRSRRRRESLIAAGGTVGYLMPTLRCATHTLEPGDLLVFATDGVRASFADDDLMSGADPKELADGILARHFRGTDDALALVARFRGPPP